MSLFADSLAYTFNFWKDNISKIFLYQLFFLLFYGLSTFVIIIGLVFLFFVPFPLSLIPLAIIAGIGTILLLVFNCIQFAGYSLMIKRVREKKKIEIIKIFKECLGKAHKILAVNILQSLPMIILGITIALLAFSFLYYYFVYSPIPVPSTGLVTLPFFRLTSMMSLQEVPPSPNYPLPNYISFNPNLISFLLYSILFIIVLGIIAWYLSTRLWLSLPVFMLEEKGCIESLKGSWKLTERKFWSITVTIFILSLILGIIDSVIGLPFNVLQIFLPGISVIPQIISYLIFTPLSLILPTAYYYSIKLEKKQKEEV